MPLVRHSLAWCTTGVPFLSLLCPCWTTQDPAIKVACLVPLSHLPGGLLPVPCALCLVFLSLVTCDCVQITFYLFHWVKGSPFAEDQGLYDKLTWWEQMDGGQQHTMNRKFMLLVPVLL